MLARNVQLIGMMQIKRLHVMALCTVELSSSAALASGVLFVSKFITIYQHMGPVKQGIPCWRKHILQS